MHRFPKGLKNARILVTNDDGIHAPGLKVLERVARALCDDVWVCAPETEQSGAGHSLTLHRPLRVRQVSGRRFAVDGTPTDCVLIAVHEVLRQDAPALVLSGVNRGANVGEDVTYSGTVAAAMEATHLGVPAIAMSQMLIDRSKRVHWQTAERFAPEVVRRLTAVGIPDGVLMNVNYPDMLADRVKGIRATHQGLRKIADSMEERIDPRGRPYYWIGTQFLENVPKSGTDVTELDNGYVSVTPIHLDLTHTRSLRALREAFA